MARARADLGAHHLLDVRRVGPVYEKADILLRREADHDAEAMAVGGVQQRARRHGVRDADRVEAVGRHLSEVALDDLEVAILVAVLIGAECAIGDPADPELIVVNVQKLPARTRPVRSGALADGREVDRGYAAPGRGWLACLR